MTAAWKEPQVEDVYTFQSSVVVDRANESDKVQRILSVVVQRFRATVGRTNTLSDNDAEVPPEALQHVLVLTVFNLINATPNFGFLMRGADGAETGFGYNVRIAEDWLKSVSRGMSVTYPVNPQSTYPELVRSGSDDLVDTEAA